MEERVARLGAKFALRSAPGQGTEVRVEVSR
jgi:signal transduction histidine kinase